MFTIIILMTIFFGFKFFKCRRDPNVYLSIYRKGFYCNLLSMFLIYLSSLWWTYFTFNNGGVAYSGDSVIVNVLGGIALTSIMLLIVYPLIILARQKHRDMKVALESFKAQHMDGKKPVSSRRPE